MRFELKLAAAILVALSAGATLRAQDDESWTIEKLEESRALGDAQAVVVSNVYGDVRCRTTDEPEVYVLANAQRHKDDPRRAAVLVGEEEGRITVEVAYPEPKDAGTLTEEMERRRVDVTVLLPSTVPLSVTTRDGLIEAKGLSRPFEAASKSGRIAFKSSGVVHARSGRGPIDATFRSTGWAEQATLATVTGDITVNLPPGAAALVEAETAGELTTDYSIQIEPHEQSSMKSAVARIGEGGGRLSVRSEKGRIRLLRSRW